MFGRMAADKWLKAAIGFCLVLTVTCADDADKTLENVSSRLQIHVPRALYKDGGYDHREALFGVPPYGGSITQNVYYADSNLCDQTVDTKKGYPQRNKDEKGEMLPWQPPYILMVDRGVCSFVQKVRNAQLSGASGVIIADNVCLCTDEDCKRVNPDAQCENAEPIMADDGSGGSVSIPSFLMFKHDADAVKEELKRDQVVQIEMQWSLPAPDDRVEYELWTTPTELVSRDFIKGFKEVALALGDRAYFSPNMFIHDGEKNKCRGAGVNLCFNLCTNGGRYCATDPDYDLNHGVSGSDVVKESLRRICIWKTYGESNGIGKEWWEYVNHFMERCDNSDFFTNQACVDDAYKQAGIDATIVESCMVTSGDTNANNANNFLQLALDAQKRRGIVVLPSAFVNTAALRGVLGVETVFRAICAGFKEGTEPDICVSCSRCPATLGCVRSGGTSCPAVTPTELGSGGAAFGVEPIKKPKSRGVSTTTFLITLFLVCAGFGGFAYYHWQKSRDDMREQVRGILADYMPLEEQPDGKVASPMDFAQRAASTQLIT